MDTMGGIDTISQRELRNSSGSVLRRVAAGETLLVTNNGVPAAMLVPVPATRLDRLIAEGRVIPASLPFDVDALPPRVKSSLSTEQVIDELRGDH